MAERKVRTRTLNQDGQWVESDIPEERLPKHRRFVLDRSEDKTGISGTGIVGEGICFTDGTAVLRWRGDIATTVAFACIEDVIVIHGHQGSTTLVWID